MVHVPVHTPECTSLCTWCCYRRPLTSSTARACALTIVLLSWRNCNQARLRLYFCVQRDGLCTMLLAARGKAAAAHPVMKFWLCYLSIILLVSAPLTSSGTQFDSHTSRVFSRVLALSGLSSIHNAADDQSPELNNNASVNPEVRAFLQVFSASNC
jgi:hypothetical protein